jgi:PIN domain nuclease of toxin-antitoxin system
MNKYVLDASAVLRLIDNEAGATQVETLFLEAYDYKSELFMNTVNWGEIVYSFMKRADGPIGQDPRFMKLAAYPIVSVPVTQNIAFWAASFKHQFKLPYVDALALGTAMEQHAALVTADVDFKPASPTYTIQFLPKK